MLVSVKIYHASLGHSKWYSCFWFCTYLHQLLITKFQRRGKHFLSLFVQRRREVTHIVLTKSLILQPSTMTTDVPLTLPIKPPTSPRPILSASAACSQMHFAEHTCVKDWLNTGLFILVVELCNLLVV